MCLFETLLHSINLRLLWFFIWFYHSMFVVANNILFECRFIGIGFWKCYNWKDLIKLCSKWCGLLHRWFNDRKRYRCESVGVLANFVCSFKSKHKESHLGTLTQGDGKQLDFGFENKSLQFKLFLISIHSISHRNIL